MRVIAGSARRINLKTVRGNNTRPTTDRIKETLFNILQGNLEDCSFLDLFAGSGGIGIEALSRGAREAVFVEQDRECCECIRHNLTVTHLSHKAGVIRGDVLRVLPMPGRKEPFDIIFLDPPYGMQLEQKVLEALSVSPAADGNTLIIIEASADTDFDWLEPSGYYLERRKEYKSNVHMFVRKKEKS